MITLLKKMATMHAINLFTPQCPPEAHSDYPITPTDDKVNYFENGQIVEEIPALSKLFKENCYKIYNIFSDELITEIKTLSKSMTRTFGNETSDMLIKISNETLRFSEQHTVYTTAALKKFDHLSPLMEQILVTFVNRFANELKWTDRHTIDFQIYRYTPLSGQDMTQKWHYDQGARKSMVMVIENDFEYFNGLGINIAQNGLSGPFNPNDHCDELNITPKDGQYISTNYPPNGAVIFDGKEGELVHQMSTLTARTFDPPKSLVRTIIQIKDRAWQKV